MLFNKIMFNFGPKIPEISVETVKNAIDNGDNVTIVDVRTPDEVTKGKIKNSINIPLDDFENNIEKRIPNKKQTVYVYCLSGSRSAMALQIMEQKGYKSAFSMTSGMLAWRAKKFPVENS
jgi:adenylyltransferase/sulfurtransferase